MNSARPIAFWITMLAAVIAAVVLLREILLPFVAGMVIAYLLDRWPAGWAHGMFQLLATLIVAIFVSASALLIVRPPIIVRELAYSSRTSRLPQAIAGAGERPRYPG
jgi:predicted PurR-regulated permease PerM